MDIRVGWHGEYAQSHFEVPIHKELFSYRDPTIVLEWGYLILNRPVAFSKFVNDIAKLSSSPHRVELFDESVNAFEALVLQRIVVS